MHFPDSSLLLTGENAFKILAHVDVEGQKLVEYFQTFQINCLQKELFG